MAIVQDPNFSPVSIQDELSGLNVEIHCKLPKGCYKIMDMAHMGMNK